MIFRHDLIPNAEERRGLLNTLLDCNTVERLIALHDQLSAQLDAARKRTEQERVVALNAALAARLPQLKKLNAEDDELILFAPEDTAELAREGRIQSICIGGYQDSYAQGSCDIYFLRKMSEPSIPFYAIEVGGGRVRQIHGAHNKWVGNDLNAARFLRKWTQKHKLQCEEHILLCKSNSYGGCNSDMLPRSAVYDD